MNGSLRNSCLLLLTAGLLATGSTRADERTPRILLEEIVICAPVEAVWHAWTTAEGSGFASSESNIALEIGGPYEWFLDGDADEQGARGSEGSRVLAFLPQQMLAFDWTFPPSIPSLRRQGVKTQVVLLFDDLGDGRVGLRLAQHGWEKGEDWDAGWEYFDAAWDTVLERLKDSLESDHPGCPESIERGLR